MGQLKTQLDNLKARGFDASYYLNRAMRVNCSQCQAVVINGMACHEHGCSNAKHECKGCNGQIPVNQKYCADCA